MLGLMYKSNKDVTQDYREVGVGVGVGVGVERGNWCYHELRRDYRFRWRKFC